MGGHLGLPRHPSLCVNAQVHVQALHPLFPAPYSSPQRPGSTTLQLPKPRAEAISPPLFLPYLAKRELLVPGSQVAPHLTSYKPEAQRRSPTSHSPQLACPSTLRTCLPPFFMKEIQDTRPCSLDCPPYPCSGSTSSYTPSLH